MTTEKTKEKTQERMDRDLDVLEEIALAMAQSQIEDTISLSGQQQKKIAELAGRPASFISKILRGSHNLTIRTMARVMGACGYELRFGREPIAITWVENIKPITVTASPPGDAPVGEMKITPTGASLEEYPMVAA